MIPALLTSTSIGPSCSSAPSRKAVNESRSVTSSGNATVLAPSSAAVWRAASTSTSPIATFIP
jgi:hypothetical protein